MSKICVYTCITGNYELPKDTQNTEGADFYLFTDNLNIKTNWKKVRATTLFTDPRRNARYHKLLSHDMFPAYDYTIWIDGSIILKVPAFNIIDRMVADVMVLAHANPKKDCAYQEAMDCLHKQLDYSDNLHGAMSYLRAEGYPEHNGLGETKVVIRKNTQAIAAMNKEWHYRLLTGTLRDQVYFNSACWKTNVPIQYMKPWPDNPWIKYIRHTPTIYA